MIGRDADTGRMPNDKTKWSDVVILDPWGHKQSEFSAKARPPMLTDMADSWIVHPRDFGGEVHSVCRFEP